MSLGNKNVLQAVTMFHGIAPKLGEAFGERDGLEMLVLTECIETKFLHTFRNDGLFNWTAIECVVSYLLYAIMQQVKRGEGALVKSIGGNGSDTLRKRHMSQQSVRVKCPLTNLLQCLRQHYFFQFGRAETSRTYLLKVGRKVDLLQIRAIKEQTIGHFLQVVRQGEFLQRTILTRNKTEDTRPQGLYSIRKGRNRNGITSSESTSADVLQRRWELREFKIFTTIKGPIAY